VENLKEEVKKGMREKAEQGIYPGRAPFGYRNDTATRTVETDPVKAPVLRRIFELYGTGDYSLSSLRNTVVAETGVSLCRAYLDSILKNRFYLGYFVWQRVEYKGTHEPLIDPNLFERVQRVFAGHNKPKYRKHAFAFAGLLTCAHDGCTVTTELHKGKYVYYRCSYGRGKCALPYMREQQVSDRLGEVLKDIQVPEEIVQAIVQSIASGQCRTKAERQERLVGIRQRHASFWTGEPTGKNAIHDALPTHYPWATRPNAARTEPGPRFGSRGKTGAIG
jgi:site-specific DNA recombinase